MRSLGVTMATGGRPGTINTTPGPPLPHRAGNPVYSNPSIRDAGRPDSDVLDLAHQVCFKARKYHSANGSSVSADCDTSIPRYIELRSPRIESNFTSCRVAEESAWIPFIISSNFRGDGNVACLVLDYLVAAFTRCMWIFSQCGTEPARNCSTGTNGPPSRIPVLGQGCHISSLLRNIFNLLPCTISTTWRSCAGLFLYRSELSRGKCTAS